VVEEDPWNGVGAKGGAAEKPRESRGRLRQVGRAQGEVRKPKCQRRHYSPGVQRLRNP
jgi:hypothetical protein